MSTNLASSRNLVRYSLTENMLDIMDNGVSGISTHLTIDETNKMVYWIHFTSETAYKIYKTPYDGASQQIGSGSGQSSDIYITEGEDFYYILDSFDSNIKKYNKSSDSVTSTITVPSGTKSIIMVIGKCVFNFLIYYTMCYLIKTHLPSLPV